MALTKAEVLHIAKLARLELKEEEVEKFRTQLSEILEYVGQLQKVDTAGIEPISQITGLQNVVREDLVRGCEPDVRDAMLEQFPKRRGDLLETLGVFE
ncbi:Asp-tRNA(Asn)/Glu-tRNA(Gln) amidotransferase subunit GatC [Candidatus Uhrbacteria bacterium]|nr:Asp-tRNA(Asn)/Glu-tRNA(Gln) amidotransferase subunit GatC [Candidatus Uhrbacteria bacterium]